uniref:Uncharacterized protein n=1 Tax=Opuntia streptacantha TaxID=393608 RepID=A0A7C8YSQ9_OPUST
MITHGKEHLNQHIKSMHTRHTTDPNHFSIKPQSFSNHLIVTKDLEKTIVCDNIRRETFLRHLFQKPISLLYLSSQAHSLDQLLVSGNIRKTTTLYHVFNNIKTLLHSITLSKSQYHYCICFGSRRR